MQVIKVRAAGAALAVATLVGAGALAGCGTHPGAAAVIGGERIGFETIRDDTQAVCTYFDTLGDVSLPKAAVSRLLLESAVTLAAARQLAEDLDIRVPDTESPAAPPGIEELPTDVQEQLAAFNEREAERQGLIIAIGEDAGGTGQQAVMAGLVALGEYLRDTDFAVDPRYGPVEEVLVTTLTEGSPEGPGDISGSLSSPVSDLAQALTDENADPAAVLDDSQICGG